MPVVHGGRRGGKSSEKQWRSDLWVCRHQILPNIHGLKYVALLRLVEQLEAGVVPAFHEKRHHATSRGLTRQSSR